jgi:hypothetical protein
MMRKSILNLLVNMFFLRLHAVPDEGSGGGGGGTADAASSTETEISDTGEQAGGPPEGFTRQEWENLLPAEQAAYGITDDAIAAQETETELTGEDLDAVAGEGGADGDDADGGDAGSATEDGKQGDVNDAAGSDGDGAAADQGAGTDGVGTDTPATDINAAAIPSDEDLLSFRPIIADSEIPIPEDVPEILQSELDALETKADQLDSWFEAGENDKGEPFSRAELRKAERELDKERQAVNRKITAHQIVQRDSLRENAIWKQEQAAFIAARPAEYAEKDADGKITDRSRMLYGALSNQVNSMLSDPANKGKSGIQILVTADRAVRKALGLPAPGKQATATKPAAKPVDAKPVIPKAPVATLTKGADINLARIPAAGEHDADPFAHIDAIKDPYAKEQAILNLNDRQRDAYLRSAR